MSRLTDEDEAAMRGRDEGSRFQRRTRAEQDRTDLLDELDALRRDLVVEAGVVLDARATADEWRETAELNRADCHEVADTLDQVRRWAALWKHAATEWRLRALALGWPGGWDVD